ncbi:hypothetical protein KO537_22780, partial [Shewanella sp. NKUCC01_JLK]|nr:hypothetical protein [Shewanella sp. NKUCC01_JLK]
MPFASRLKGSKLAVFSQVTLMNIAFSAALIFSVMGLSINANAADEAMPQEYIYGPIRFARHSISILRRVHCTHIFGLLLRDSSGPDG